MLLFLCGAAGCYNQVDAIDEIKRSFGSNAQIYDLADISTIKIVVVSGMVHAVTFSYDDGTIKSKQFLFDVAVFK